MKPHEKAAIAERLTQLRVERGLTRNQVADALGLALSTVAGYEQAYRAPKFENLKKLASFYRVSLEYLLGQDEREPLVIKEIKIDDAVLEDFILKVNALCKNTDLSSREKKEELDLLIDFLEMRISKKLNK